MSTYTIESMSDTIAAQATAPGEAAIAIVRVSGPKVRELISTLTQSSTNRESHRAFVAQLHDDEGPFEEALVLPMLAPRSYTGEDSVEFHVHGSRPTIARVMRAALANGARLAQPGEFTLRAFLNGKLDLVQAEAVKDLIHAGSDEALKVAHAHLKGVLSDSLESVESALEGVVADAKAALDFPEYPTGDGLEGRHKVVVDGARDTISTLLSRVELGLMKTLDVGRAEYDSYLRNGMLTQLQRLELGADIEEAHMRNRAWVSNWCFEKGQSEGVVEKVVRDGKTYIDIKDYDRLRELFGELLREVQRIKSQGDYDAAKALVEGYGVKVNQEEHKEILDRVAVLGVAPYGGFINPEMTAERDAEGNITSVAVTYPDDFTGQMLRYSEQFSFLPDVN